MKCTGCGYESLDLFETCKYCSPPQAAKTGPPAAPPAVVEMLDDDVSPFRIDDDIFLEHDRGALEAPGPTPRPVDWARHHDGWPAAGADLPGPAFVFPDEDRGSSADVESIIDRDDEVPERYWAPEVAGLGQRALALLVDLCILAAVLGVFYLGALVALHRNELAVGVFLSAEGRQASALPFALLAALLSLAYCSFFHGSAGRTPGKALLGVEVRTSAGGSITWGRAILRWLGAALGFACAGVGMFWAVFEPRRRGWADLISGTVVASRLRESAPGVSRR